MNTPTFTQALFESMTTLWMVVIATATVIALLRLGIWVCRRRLKVWPDFGPIQAVAGAWAVWWAASHVAADYSLIAAMFGVVLSAFPALAGITWNYTTWNSE